MAEKIIAQKQNRTQSKPILKTGKYVVEKWMDTANVKPVYMVCRNYNGATFPLMMNFKPMAYDLSYDACAAAMMAAEVSPK